MVDLFRLNEPNVACEVMDGDIILLNFQSGFYYNVRGLGAELCQYLLVGGTLDQAAASIGTHFTMPAAGVLEEISVFVATLIEEGLLVPTTGQASSSPLIIRTTLYEKPRCEKFDDLADQLLLDKIDDQSKDAQWTSPQGI